MTTSSLIMLHYALLTRLNAINFRRMITMYYVLCTMYYVLCTMFYVQCTMYNVLCTMYYRGMTKSSLERRRFGRGRGRGRGGLLVFE
jgi:hypothetical protein